MVRAASALRALALFVVILLILSAQAASATAPSDDFNRPNGSLGSSWAAMSDGALSISSQAVVGTSATAGDIRTAETYGSDQSSQIQLTPTQLSGGQWVGPAVRTQNGGQNTYLGMYFWNNGSPQLRLYKRSAGTWIQLGSSYNSGSAGRRDDAPAERRRLDDLVPAGRRHADHRHRHQHQRRRARDHDVRQGQGRQLGGRRRDRTRARPTRSAAASPGSPARSCCRTTAATT